MIVDVKRVKISVTVPEEDLDMLRNSVCEMGVGVIGEYSHCTMATKCIGTFKPSQNANPYIGKQNVMEYAKEEKLEFICDVDLAKRVIKKIREVHPYEEPGIDIYPLIDEDNFN